MRWKASTQTVIPKNDSERSYHPKCNTAACLLRCMLSIAFCRIHFVSCQDTFDIGNPSVRKFYPWVWASNRFCSTVRSAVPKSMQVSNPWSQLFALFDISRPRSRAIGRQPVCLSCQYQSNAMAKTSKQASPQNPQMPWRSDRFWMPWRVDGISETYPVRPFVMISGWPEETICMLGMYVYASETFHQTRASILLCMKLIGQYARFVANKKFMICQWRLVMWQCGLPGAAGNTQVYLLHSSTSIEAQVNDSNLQFGPPLSRLPKKENVKVVLHNRCRTSSSGLRAITWRRRFPILPPTINLDWEVSLICKPGK